MHRLFCGVKLASTHKAYHLVSKKLKRQTTAPTFETKLFYKIGNKGLMAQME